MFVVYNIPTVGICRAEQRAKACQKLGISYVELGGLDYGQDGVGQTAFSSGKQNGSSGAFNTLAQQQHSRKRAVGQTGWNDGLMMQDALMGGDMAAAAAAMAAGDPNMGMPMQVCGTQLGWSGQHAVWIFVGPSLFSAQAVSHHACMRVQLPARMHQGFHMCRCLP
jgi:hypothetical protein